MKHIKEYNEYSFSNSVKDITKIFNIKFIRNELLRYFNGVKGESKDAKKSLSILYKRTKGEIISVEERKFIVKEMFEWLKAGGILLPIYLIPLPIISEVIIVLLDNLLQKTLGYKFLPDKFYPEIEPTNKVNLDKKIDPNKIEQEVKDKVGIGVEEEMDILNKIRHYRGNTDDFKKFWKSKELNEMELVDEEIVIPVEIGDTILRGRFRNRKVIVKTIGKDEHGGPTINGKKVLTFRLMKKQPPKDKKLITDGEETNKKMDCVMAFADIKSEIWDSFLDKINRKDLYVDENNPDEYGYEIEPHITIVYGILSMENNKDSILTLIKNFKSFSAQCSGIGIFESTDYDVVKLNIIPNEQILEYRKILLDNTKNEQTYSEFKPHMTLAYVKKGEGKKYIEEYKNPITFYFDSIVYSDYEYKQTKIDI